MTRDEALALLQAPAADLPAILARATAARRAAFGDTASLCSILNARSGRCAEDCVFCAQSARHGVAVETHPLVSARAIVAAFDEAAALPIGHFGIVTSGHRLTDRQVDRIAAALRRRRARRVRLCASLGALGPGQMARLRAAGLTRYHHNLETAESFFPHVCTTHTYAERVATIRAALRAGLEVCAGGVFGLGETAAQRVELALALRELAVDAIPLNFLVPIPGTPAADRPPMTPEEILKTIAMVRLVCPTAEIKVCAGREKHLGVREADIFAAGANGMMIGGYLTVQGRAPEADLALLARAGMTV
jgi:biotin synthase